MISWKHCDDLRTPTSTFYYDAEEYIVCFANLAILIGRSCYGVDRLGKVLPNNILSTRALPKKSSNWLRSKKVLYRTRDEV
jgi:hypothetical protein